MSTELRRNSSKDDREIKQSLRGKISIVFGIFNLIISIAIFWALRSYINQEYVDSLLLQVRILNIGSKVELFTKPVGLLIGIAGIFEKKCKENSSILWYCYKWTHTAVDNCSFCRISNLMKWAGLPSA